MLVGDNANSPIICPDYFWWLFGESKKMSSTLSNMLAGHAARKPSDRRDRRIFRPEMPAGGPEMASAGVGVLSGMGCHPREASRFSRGQFGAFCGVAMVAGVS